LIVKTKSKQEIAYQTLRSRIESSRYVPSQRLVIDQLAKELNMSQVPIREAIRRLEAEGLVLFSVNSGPLVAPVSRDQWFQLMEVLAVLEGYATAQAASNIGEAQLRALRKINDNMRKALAKIDLEAWTEQNREFHRVIHEQCPNKSLVDEIARTRQRADMLGRLSFARERGVIIHALGISVGKDTIEKHEQIINAFEEGAPASRIERLTRRHVMDPVDRVRRSLDN
jgi:DNA-binding GntR family transcriptional regulator